MTKAKIHAILLAIVILLMPITKFESLAQDTPGIPKRLLIDDANLFTPAQRAVILDSLKHFAATTSNGIMVVTTNDLNGLTPMEAAYEIGQKSGLGTKEHDNGIVILVKPKQGNSRGEMAIAVGYGLEGALPDATCKMIIMRQAIPEFQRNDYYAGIMNTLNVVMPIARGEYSIDNYGETDDDLGPIMGVCAIIFALFLIFFIIGRNKNNDNDDNYRGGGGRTFGVPIIFPIGGFGHGSSGGGFGGFGGFGGGSFGGGGASGSW